MNESTTFIPSHNRIVYDRILQLVASKETKNYEEKVHEFDGCNYLMQSSKEGTWRLSFARPAPQDGAEEEDDQVARDAVSEAFQNVAAVRPEPEDGYDVTIDLEVSFLRRLDFEQQAFWAKTLASIRLLWTGAALR